MIKSALIESSVLSFFYKQLVLTKSFGQRHSMRADVKNNVSEAFNCMYHSASQVFYICFINGCYPSQVVMNFFSTNNIWLKHWLIVRRRRREGRKEGSLDASAQTFKRAHIRQIRDEQKQTLWGKQRRLWTAFRLGYVSEILMLTGLQWRGLR